MMINCIHSAQSHMFGHKTYKEHHMNMYNELPFSLNI